jgi:transcriptional regulator with XRE-family HTH domain
MLRLGQVVGQRVLRTRERLGLTQQQLAQRTAELGHSLNRVTIAKIEAGAKEGARNSDRVRADNVTLADVLVLAAALDTAPPLLFIPLGDDETVAFGERLEMHPHLMLDWVCGDEAFTLLPDNYARHNEAWSENVEPLRMFRALRRRQDRVQQVKWALERAIDDGNEQRIAEAQRRFDEQVLDLHELRSIMSSSRLSLPDLPDEWQQRLDELGSEVQL